MFGYNNTASLQAVMEVKKSITYKSGSKIQWDGLVVITVAMQLVAK